MWLLMTWVLLQHIPFVSPIKLCWQNIQVFDFEGDKHSTLYSLHWFAIQLVSLDCSMPKIGAAAISFFINWNVLSCSGPQLKGTFLFTYISDWLCELRYPSQELWQVVNHANKWLYLLFTLWSWHLLCGLDLILHWLMTICCISFSKEFDFFLFVLEFLIV